LITILMMGLVSRAEAAVLAPSKPSQVATITGDAATSAFCPSGLVAGKMVDTQRNADGTITSFSVPVGEAFVVTSWEWSGSGAASSTIGMSLVLVDSATLLGSFSRSTAAADGSGIGGGSVVIPSGFVVKSGITMCYAGGGASASVIVHGFFAKDR
jgi:hypothetical protein